MKDSIGILYFVIFGIFYPYFAGKIFKKYWHALIFINAPAVAFFLGFFAK